MSRWTAIESTYERALNAIRAYPDEKPRDVFEITVRSKQTREIVKVIYCVRWMFGLQNTLLAVDFPPAEFEIGVQPSCAPYRPKKGEPSFERWREEKEGRL